MTTQARPTLIITAHYDGKVIVPDEPLDLPANTPLQIHVLPPAPKPKTALRKLADALAELPSDPDLPTDAAAQKRHYLYGAPKEP